MTLFTRACFGEVTERIPVWMMRQAGRYLPAYQALKERASFLELCQKPELAAQATLDAARILDTDAAIIFSDITIPGAAMGLPLEFAPGPKFGRAVRTERDIEALKIPDPGRDMGYVLEAIRKTRAELPSHVSLIGFVGAPFTLASYMIEGEPTRSWVAAKAMAYGEPELLEALLDKVTAAVVAHARAQIEAGCDAIQLFDSHAGELAEEELIRFAFGSSKRAVDALRSTKAPMIYFARGVAAHLREAAKVGADVLGLDWTVSVARARRELGDAPALMGNLDPTALFTTIPEITRRVHRILDEARGHRGFIMNLGHGILPKTPPEHARAVVDAVRSWR